MSWAQDTSPFCLFTWLWCPGLKCRKDTNTSITLWGAWIKWQLQSAGESQGTKKAGWMVGRINNLRQWWLWVSFWERPRTPAGLLLLKHIWQCAPTSWSRSQENLRINQYYQQNIFTNLAAKTNSITDFCSFNWNCKYQEFIWNGLINMKHLVTAFEM